MINIQILDPHTVRTLVHDQSIFQLKTIQTENVYHFIKRKFNKRKYIDESLKRNGTEMDILIFYSAFFPGNIFFYL